MTRTLRVGAGLGCVLICALLLSGCGRKGPLDPPPSALQQPGAPVNPDGTPAPGTQKGFDEFGRPIAPTGEKKHFFLDFLLD